MRFTLIVCCLTLCICGEALAGQVRVTVHDDEPGKPVSPFLTGACIEDVNHEIYGGLYSQMIFGESFQEPAKDAAEISGMWRAVRRGSATGAFRLVTENAFVGAQSQAMEFKNGDGAAGVENMGLNRWGMFFKESANYEGVVWTKAETPVELWASLENADGSVTYAEQKLHVAPGDWQRIPFELVSHGTDKQGRFSLTLRQPGAVTLGYAFLQPGEWGRFKGLPVRRDVAEGLQDEGVTVLRYGGSMVNHAEYRWKNMIGPRDKRPPCHGTWYPYSTNGWGIVDFMNFCEAAGFECIPAFNANETPQDMADFIEYAKGAADSTWGKKRVEDGHPEPYKLSHIEIGNEERVDEEYAARFVAIARRVWPLDPDMVLVVGDFAYGKPITDPFDISGAAARLKTLKGQQNVLRLARENGREVWFDVHMGTEGPRPDSSLGATFTFIDALEKLAGGAKFRVVVFEFNAGNHSQKRGLANALAMNAIQRDGRIPVSCSANCLQPDGQNDNAWDQGLLFLNPAQVWLQPPGWVLRMASHHYAPLDLRTEVLGSDTLDACARRSQDGKMLVLQAVNLSDSPTDARLFLKGFAEFGGVVHVETLSAPLDAVNTAGSPQNAVSQASERPYQLDNGEVNHTFAPHSFTVMEFNLKTAVTFMENLPKP